VFTYAHLNTPIDQSMGARMLPQLFYKITFRSSCLAISLTPYTQHFLQGRVSKLDSHWFYGKNNSVSNVLARFEDTQDMSLSAITA